MPVSTKAQPSVEERAACESLVTALSRAMKNISFYEVRHPVVRDVLTQLHTDLTRYLTDKREFVIKFVNGYVVLQNVPLLTNRAAVGNLLGACHRRQAESLVFRRGVTLDELEQLVTVLAADTSEVEQEGGLGRVLEARGVERIVVGAPKGRPHSNWRWIHSTTLDVLRGAAAGVRTGRPMDVASVHASVGDIMDDVLGDRTLVHNLTSLKGMDEYTFIHALNICVLAGELGRHINLSREHLDELGAATLLHDVGKVLVPLEVLRKPAALDEVEFQIMSRHPVDGAIMLSREPRLPESAAVVAFEHHMHYDFSGYPQPTHPRHLHLFSLMATIVDVYDALTSTRPYRPPLPPQRALEVMQHECRGHLEPRLFGHFVAMLGPYPWGTLLGLPDGRMAVVTRPNASRPDNPLARVIALETAKPGIADSEVPVRQLAARGEFQVLDPATLGIDLTALLHELHGDEVQGAAVPLS